jgi:hypothetical protein
MLAPQTSGNLIRRPTLRQAAADRAMDVRSIGFGKAGPHPSTLGGTLLGHMREVHAIDAVACEFAPDRAAVPIQGAPDLGIAAAGEVHLGYSLTFVLGKVLGHRWDSFRPAVCTSG